MKRPRLGLWSMSINSSPSPIEMHLWPPSHLHWIGAGQLAVKTPRQGDPELVTEDQNTGTTLDSSKSLKERKSSKE